MSNEADGVKAWHFLQQNRRLRYCDSREVVAGETLEASGDLRMCENGMHASINILDALGYAPGCVVSRVEVFGNVFEHPDKIVGRARKCLWLGDARLVLIEFAQWSANRAAGHAYAANANANADTAANAAANAAAYADTAANAAAYAANAAYADTAANAAAYAANASTAANAAAYAAYADARQQERKLQSEKLEALVRFAAGEYE